MHGPAGRTDKRHGKGSGEAQPGPSPSTAQALVSVMFSFPPFQRVNVRHIKASTVSGRHGPCRCASAASHIIKAVFPRKAPAQQPRVYAGSKTTAACNSITFSSHRGCFLGLAYRLFLQTLSGGVVGEGDSWPNPDASGQCSTSHDRDCCWALFLSQSLICLVCYRRVTQQGWTAQTGLLS